jgi:tRNA1Val (adenine37-N6)-methyltransferase
MGRNNYFQFKQFRIIQEMSAMKVGTDGVLLGAWVNLNKARRILDVGTGTGLIALMMAQRLAEQITGIELDKNAADEAAQNCADSPWSNRITIINLPFQNYSETASPGFDLIISNPPFFVNNQKSKNNRLAIAKHNDLLPFSDLIEGSIRLLDQNGRLAIILPVAPAQTFIELAARDGLYLNRLTEVRPNSQKQVHRYLMEFDKNKTAPIKDCLYIHRDDIVDFTPEYKKLTGEFYLNF